ncbi:hypothetical protein SRABI27_01296 [Pedobacter sp. Bi27]|uniref:energy transducer TonB n=1 Tax=unclassified Pedobacter TaxID=2628915 RepID=UPI001DAA9207|nr:MULTISPECIES: energy transducer TonB [unclassified Pedobacter]CAH0182663.1 hypothetical protein SRABI27_01296 [Pedobacter sp. Bi27]CAH0291864.1 hypothetical protein SRABI36_04334 [Pedobacter sp. Bi36]CAH0303262.1 hypothetical protein SRABI126_04455 [Pedobacter sp. Bi126]
MKYFLLILIFSCSSAFDRSTGLQVYKDSDELPEFPGGGREQHRFFYKLMSYPQEQAGENFEGVIRGSFIITKSGSSTGYRIEDRSEKDYTSLDKEFIRVARLMPKWKPGRCNGKKVAVRVFYTINF